MVPLKLQQGRQGTSHVASGKSCLLSCCEGEHRIALESFQGNWASSHSERGKSWFSPVAAGSFVFLLICDGDLSDLLNFLRDIRPPFKLQGGTSGFLSSHCSGIGPLLKLRFESQVSSPVVTGILGFLSSFNWGVRPHLILRHGSLLSSQVVKEVSGLLLGSGWELGLFLEVLQESQTSLHVVRGYSGFHVCRCKGIRPYLELRKKLCVLSTYARNWGVPLYFQYVRQASS